MARLSDAQRRELVRDGILTINEAAAMLRCKRTKVYDLVKAGAFRYTRAGKEIRIPKRAIEAYLAAGLV